MSIVTIDVNHRREGVPFVGTVLAVAKVADQFFSAVPQRFRQAAHITKILTEE
jgi:hypothetical protein